MPVSSVFLEGPYEVDFKKPWPPEAEQRAAGVAARTRVSRRALGVWEPADEARDPVAVVMAAAASRQAHLIPLRTARMAVSAFTFYRGAAQLMANDLAMKPHTGIYAQMCGDAHLANFGIYASPERTPVFDINDFDETSQGPWCWDLKRLTTSFVLAARDNGQAGRSEQAVRTAARAYVAALNEMAGLGWLERRHRMIRADAPVAHGVVWTGKMTALVNQVVSKAVRRTQAWTVGKYTEVVDGAPRLRLDPPVITAVSRRTAAAVTASLRPYLESLSAERRAYLRGYHVVDIAHKVVGVGSVGAYDYIVLLMGAGMRDQLLLQVKEAELSAVKTALGERPQMAYGEGVVVGSWLLQGISDPFLGWTQLHGRSFYVRQLKDMKGSIDPARLTGTALVGYAYRCGYTLGLAHSRAGDPHFVLGYVGKGAALTDAMWRFSEAYADQTERDYVRFIAAIHDGRLEAAELAPIAPAAPSKAAQPKKVTAKAVEPKAAKGKAARTTAVAAKGKAAKGKASGGVKK